MENNNAINQSIVLIEQEIARLQAAVRYLKGDGQITSTSSISMQGTASIVNASDNRFAAGYKPNLSLRDAFLHYLEIHKRFVHLREVSDWIVINERMSPTQSSQVATDMSAALGILKKSNKIVKVQPKSSNNYTYWGLPKWLETDGVTVKKEHMYDTAYPKLKSGRATELTLDF